MAKYRLSHQADIDLDEIADYLGQRSLVNAKRVLEALFEAFHLLAESPLLGTLREDLKSELRVFSPGKPAASYLIFYYPRSDGIDVVTVIHGARDYLGMFQSGQRR